MQISQIMTGDPASIISQLVVLAATNKVQIIQKTKSSGSYIVVSDNTAPTGQSFVVIKGDPDTVSAETTALIALGNVVEIVAESFNAAVYIVVYS